MILSGGGVSDSISQDIILLIIYIAIGNLFLDYCNSSTWYILIKTFRIGL